MRLVYTNFRLVLFFTLIINSVLFAGETGKIAGRITDSETGEPLAFANVIIVSEWIDGEEFPLENMRGAASDINGDYFLINISPGIYNVKVSYLGFHEEIRTQVKVSIDKTTTVDFILKSEALSVVGDVVVTAFTIDKAERDLTATKSSYDLSKIEALPGVNDVSDILSLQADVSDGHFRGGRTGESQYLIGGTSIVNPLNNSRAFDPMTIAFQQVEVYTSGFSAEYGNVQSGVINMITKEGNSNKWQVRIDAASTNSFYKTWGGSVYNTRNLMYYEMIKNPDEWVDGNDPVGGSVLWAGRLIAPWADKYLPEPPLTFPPSELSREDSLRTASLIRALWLQSQRDVGRSYAKPDYRMEVSLSGPLSKNLAMFVAARYNVVNPVLPSSESDLQQQVLSSFTYKPTQNDKFKLLINYNHQINNEFNSDFFRNLERVFNLNVNRNSSTQVGLEWNRVLNQSTFVDFKLGYLTTNDVDDINFLPDNEYSTLYNNSSNWRFYTGPTNHNVGSLRTTTGDSKTTSLSLSGSITSQVDKYNLVKAGLQFFYYDMDVDRRISASTESNLRLEQYHKFPFEGAMYIQDKMEFEGMVANIGLRADFYDFNTTYFTDKFSPFRNPSLDPMNYYDPDLAGKKETELSLVLQPRIGISFPVDDQTVLHLNYGIFTQRPAFQYIYINRFKLEGTVNFVRLGNPELKPEKTISYDLGIVRRLPYGFSLDLSAYLKDVSNLVQFAIYKDNQGNQYETFDNKEYADIKGFQVALEKNEGILRGFLKYSWASATGKSSSVFGIGARSTYDEADPELSELPDPEDVYLDYDRTHRVLGNLTLRTNDEGLGIADFTPFSNMSFSATYTYQSGRPFTYDVSGEGLRFNERTPDEHDLKLRVDKTFRIGQTNLNVYVEGFNILNEYVFDYSNTFSEDPTNDYETDFMEDRENIFTEDIAAPYTTNIESFLLGNLPRYFRFGISLKF